MVASSIFSLSFFKMVAALLNISIGFISGRWLNMKNDTLSQLLYYFISPITFFVIAASNTINLGNLSLILTSFILCSLTCIGIYFILKRFMSEVQASLLSVLSSAPTCGSFLFPTVTDLFDESMVLIYLMVIVGIGFYESSVGFYVCARNLRNTKVSIKKILSVPMLHAFAFGVVWNLLGLNVPYFLDDFFHNIRNMYSIVGMLVIGISISSIAKIKINKEFLIYAIVLKMIVQPLVFCLFILLDHYIIGEYSFACYKILILVSISPISGGMVFLAVLTGFAAETVIIAVLISILLELIYLPTILSIIVTYM